MFFDDCEWSIREHQAWMYKENSEGDVPGNEPFQDSNNHTCDALKELVAERLTYHQPKSAYQLNVSD